jgi:hypothetical protein
MLMNNYHDKTNMMSLEILMKSHRLGVPIIFSSHYYKQAQ